MLKYTFRPLGTWSEPSTPGFYRRSRSTFRAGWQDTLDLLARELEHLDGRNVVIMAAFHERDLRLDGMPRSDARAPQHPGVRVAFDSRHGPLTYATDSHEFWQHNVRAIALGLQALRAVDRYGVTRKGEQYKGWRQLEAGPGDRTMSYDQALATIARLSAELPGHYDHGRDMARYRADPSEVLRDYRAACKLHHPDNGGAAETFRLLQAAKRTIDKAGQAG